MSGPARTGVLFYAKNLDRMSSFYERVLGARVVFADEHHKVLQSADVQLIVHAIPPHIAETFTVAVPPEPRAEQAIKPFFTVASLTEAERIATERGGVVMGPIWPAPGLRVRNVCDPEGNIVHLRERVADSA